MEKKHMTGTGFEEYKKNIEKNLYLISRVLKKAVNGEGIGKIDISKIDNGGFTDVYNGVNSMIDKIMNIEKRCAEHKKIDEVRIEILHETAGKVAHDNELITIILGKTTKLPGITSSGYFTLDEKGNAVCTIHSEETGAPSMGGLVVSSDLLMREFHRKEYIIRSRHTDVGRPGKSVAGLLKERGVESFIFFPFPCGGTVSGFFAFCFDNPEQHPAEPLILVLREIVILAGIKTCQIHAENDLREANLELEQKVREGDHELKRINEVLKKDISHREMIERALRENEELYRTLIITCPDPIIITDLNFNITMVNKATLEINGIEDEDMLIGINAIEFIAPQDREIAVGNAKRTLEEGEVVFVEYTLLKHDGTPYPAELCASAIIDPDGNPRAFLAVIRDLTRRKEAEEALEKEKELFEVTLRSINEGVITTDIEGKVILINRVAEKLTGWNQKDALGKDFNTIFTIIKDRTLEYNGEFINDILRFGKNIDFLEDKILLSRDGSKITISGNGAPVVDKEGKIKGSVFVFRDIREKKMLEKEIFRSRNIESLGLLAGGIAHDFNNILTGVITNISIANTLLNEEGEIKDLLKSAEKAVFRASRLTNQLLTFSKGGAPVKENSSIVDLIQESAYFCLSGSNIGCTFDLPDDLWTVEIDKGQMYQVLNNIIYNAKEAMREGGDITITAENKSIKNMPAAHNAYEIFLRPGKYIKVRIEDSGCGIEKKNLDRIFDPYFTTKEYGSGLGLTSAYSIVKKHGGFISVDSEPGKGSVFEFYLPAQETEARENDVYEETFPLSGGRVLVMDDDEDVRKVMVKLLFKMGYSADAVREGKEAIDMYRRAKEEDDPYRMVIMDLTIRGGMQGKEAVKHILEYDPEAKVLVSSGYSNDPVLSHYTDYGFCGVVPKPFNLSALKIIFSKVFEER
ncbi:MAG: PAS domain S-box protein [Spirochaetales bacterium]|nr:PAS domain S-box protein [Spirochaetales bacterium]